jgi:hypothetical protein
MKASSVAPCGVICDICLGFQREKNRCVGCNAEGNKPGHCAVCGIRTCPEKHGEESALCDVCARFPCRRIKDLDKRYRTKYGESPIGNLSSIRSAGIEDFLLREEVAWLCPRCGSLLCVHRDICLKCGGPNGKFPAENP